MTLNWPWWLLLIILGVDIWPVTLSAAIVLLILSALTRGWLRWTALVAALPCMAVIAVAAWWSIGDQQRDDRAAEFEAKTHQVLERDQIVDGLSLPAGTELQWWDIEHSKLHTASPPVPVMLFGMHVGWISRADDGGGWDLQLSETGMIDGWTCDRVGVGVSPDGQLRHCQLAGGRAWKDWPIPAGSLLDLTTTGKIGLVLPSGASMAAPEIGHPLTDTGIFAFNTDGSLDQFYFDLQDPLRVAGRQLWNSVQWTYDPATYGQGRRRHAIMIHGTLVLDGRTGGNVTIRLADSKVTAEN